MRPTARRPPVLDTVTQPPRGSSAAEIGARAASFGPAPPGAERTSPPMPRATPMQSPKSPSRRQSLLQTAAAVAKANSQPWVRTHPIQPVFPLLGQLLRALAHNGATWYFRYDLTTDAGVGSRRCLGSLERVRAPTASCTMDATACCRCSAL